MIDVSDAEPAGSEARGGPEIDGTVTAARSTVSRFGATHHVSPTYTLWSSVEAIRRSDETDHTVWVPDDSGAPRWRPGVASRRGGLAQSGESHRAIRDGLKLIRP